MESLIQEIYDEIGSCQLSNNTKNEILKNEREIEKLEKSHLIDWMKSYHCDQETAELIKVIYQMCMDAHLRDKERLNIQLERFNNINKPKSKITKCYLDHPSVLLSNTHIGTNNELLEYINYFTNNDVNNIHQYNSYYNSQKKNTDEVTQIKSTDLLDLPEYNYDAIRNKLTFLKSEIIKNKKEITKFKDICHKRLRSGAAAALPPSGMYGEARSLRVQVRGCARAVSNHKELDAWLSGWQRSLLRNKERIMVQLYHTTNIWKNYTDEVAQKNAVASTSQGHHGAESDTSDDSNASMRVLCGRFRVKTTGTSSTQARHNTRTISTNTIVTFIYNTKMNLT